MIIKRRILLVDDEPYNLIALKIMLSKCNIPEDLIDRAYNGQEAYEMVQKAYKLKQYSYGLIIMDCSMPIMDGYEAT
jgi:CheY-like chemotaxis protein